jgi:microcystin-dependent protein
MATITGFTADRMLAMEASTIVDGDIVNGELILTKHDGSTVNAGPVVGPPGPSGPVGPGGTFIPGEIRLWAGTVLPAKASYGTWVWADGAVYIVNQHPLAAANIATQWRTFSGASDPGAANFRVPDLRGLVPAGLDAMPGGTRANRMTRAVAITIAAKTGEETHIIGVNEMPAHTHSTSGSGTAVGSAAVIARAGSVTSGDMAALRSTGGGVAHENVQPTVFVPYIVCLDG